MSGPKRRRRADRALAGRRHHRDRRHQGVLAVRLDEGGARSPQKRLEAARKRIHFRRDLEIRTTGGIRALWRGNPSRGSGRSSVLCGYLTLRPLLTAWPPSERSFRVVPGIRLSLRRSQSPSSRRRAGPGRVDTAAAAARRRSASDTGAPLTRSKSSCARPRASHRSMRLSPCAGEHRGWQYCRDGDPRLCARAQSRTSRAVQIDPRRLHQGDERLQRRRQGRCGARLRLCGGARPRHVELEARAHVCRRRWSAPGRPQGVRILFQDADEDRDEGPSSPNARFIANAYVALGTYFLDGIPNTYVKVDPSARAACSNTPPRCSAIPTLNTTSPHVGGRRRRPQGHPRCVRWLNLAAEKNHRPSQALLGHILFTGNGVPRQAAQGLMWPSLAREGADPRRWLDHPIARSGVRGGE